MPEFDPKPKCKCEDCGHVCYVDELLTARHPFYPDDSDEKCNGCPICLAIDVSIGVCSAVVCARPSSIGMKHADGVYRRTCGDHGPKNTKEQ